MSYATTAYISIGGNRHSAAADWSKVSGQLAYGADQSVALWQPLHPLRKGISTLLRGHSDKVTTVKFVADIDSKPELLVTGSASGELCFWQFATSEGGWILSGRHEAHDGALNTIAGVEGSNIVASGGADGTVKLWKVEQGASSHLHSVKLTPRYIPLTVVLGRFGEVAAEDSLFLAVGGTRNNIQVFALTHLSAEPQHELQATLAGHEGWIRSLSLKRDSGGDLLLASASHDKYVRLWRFHADDVGLHTKLGQQMNTSLFENTLTSKIQTISVAGAKYSITFEALLLGHEDWIYSATWSPSYEVLQLLTASADGSLTIWEPDPSSGIWVSASRLGEISGQKGATTATGSAGGFWTGIWSANGEAIACLGRTGGWRLWEYDSAMRYWIQKTGVSGHAASATGISWSPCGGYLLSTSSDQTTRLHAEWVRGSERTWHEFARPQIHGYDLNCIATIDSSRFVSGADEKLLRVFDEPKAVANMLKRLGRIETEDLRNLPDVAAMPVLGLSNKAIEDIEDPTSDERTELSDVPPEMASLDIGEPPTEDVLARHTLWPETEKLYGHGYEISAAASHFGLGVLATACKASSVDHAVIRLYDTNDWHEVKPALSSHSLTATRLAFSNSPEAYLLSVGRDRQWTLFSQDGISKGAWKVCQSHPKAHSRMILDCAWSPAGANLFFATAGRDKTVKVWVASTDGETQFNLRHTLKFDAPVTSISFVSDKQNNYAFLAVGEEDGQISMHVLDTSKGAVEQLKSVKLGTVLGHIKAINRLEWRPTLPQEAQEAQGVRRRELAVAGADGSVRILHVDLQELCAPDH